MTLSADDMNNIVGSIGSFFKSLVSSFKLLGSTLALNLNVIQASFSNDKKKIGEAFEKFAQKRREYDKETKENLKYFREFYEMDGIDGLGGFGPKFLVFAANPLLYASTRRTDKLYSDEASPYVPPEIKGYYSNIRAGSNAEAESKSEILAADAATTKKEKKKSKTRVAITPRVERALNFFGYRYSTGISEQAVPAPAQVPGQAPSQLKPEAQREIQKLGGIAKKYVDDERLRAEEILKIVSGRVAVVKKIAEAKNFDELINSLSQASSAGLKLYDSNIKNVKEKISSELQKQQKEDPEKFKEAVKKMRQQAPGVTETDDLKAAETIMLGAAKSQIQGQLVSAYDSIFNEASRAMGLPISTQDRANLSTTEIGKSYLSMLDDFDRKLQTGQVEIAAAKSKKA
jgi:hypothetical protein